MELDFKGKKVLVTGAGQGIGRCLCQALARGGAEVFAISRTAKHLDTLKEEFPSINIFAQDVSQWKELKDLVESFPAMDGLVNNAGINILEPILDVKEEHFDQILSTNLKAALNVSQSVARKMIDSKICGSIVNVSSQASLVGLANHVSYAASKAGMDQMTRVMAVEFGPHKIRANAVNPTVTMTELGKAYWKGDRVEPMRQKVPIGRFAEPEDVVNTILFLLSDKSGMTTGTILPVDGGYTAQ